MQISVFASLGVLVLFFAFGLGLYLAPVVLVVTPLAVWRRDRIHLGGYDFYGPFGPYSVWFLLVLLFRGGKSLSNLTAEPLCLGLVMAVLAALRLLAAGRFDEKRLSLFALSLAALAAVLVWWLVPGLPE